MKLIAGANGFLGSAIKKELCAHHENAVFFTRKEYDFVSDAKIPRVKEIETIIYCADYYPGIDYTSKNPVEVYLTNTHMYESLFALAASNDIHKVITIGTTACYPVTDEPLTEEMFATHAPEKVNQKMLGYALSRFTLVDIALAFAAKGIRHHHFILPNLYGPKDKFQPGKSHLLSSWIRDFSAAQERGDATITLWGSPSAQREFMYVDDAAQFVLALANHQLDHELINVGYEFAPSYQAIAKEILHALGYYTEDRLVWDETRKNNRMREVLDITRLRKYKDALPPTQMNFTTSVRKTVEYYTQVKRGCIL